jgi:hypothetical protein
MGAQLWYHDAPWYPDPADALKALQARVLAEQYDLHTLLPRMLIDARQSVASVEAEGDEYGLLELYREQVRLVEDYCTRPIPQDPESQIEILRKVMAYGGEGIGNILDVEGVSDARGFPRAQRLTEADVMRLVGTTRPTIRQARDLASMINEELGRGESVCFPFYEGGETDPPAGWYFVGNTID